MIHDHRRCDLGEGPLWHPTRHQLFWFDIMKATLMTRDREGELAWEFPDLVSAAGWVSEDVLLIASESELFTFDLETGETEGIAPLEADRPDTRSNDGRADPLGGFWIGTMGKKAQKGAGAIYRFYKGEVRLLYPNITIPNSICFRPDGKTAYFADSATFRVMRVALDAEGWPMNPPQQFIDLQADRIEPDGAVVDAEGTFWLAQWGASRVAAYNRDGKLLRIVPFDAPHTSCPAFGGPDLSTLYCTSAMEGMDEAARAAHPNAGKTFAAPGIAKGLAEYRVLL